MNEIIKVIKSDKVLSWSFLIILFLLLIHAGFILLNLSKLPPYLPLFNQLAWGEKRIGSRNEIFIPIIISCTIFFCNFVLLSFLYQKTPLIARIICITTLLTSFFTLLFVMRTVWLII